MLYVNDGKLEADEIKIVGSGDVEVLVAGGWRILGIVGQSEPGPPVSSYATWYGGTGQSNSANLDVPGQPVFVPLFIMGRDGENAKLHQRVLDAEAKAQEARKSSDEVAMVVSDLEKQLTEAAESGKTLFTQLTELRNKMTQMEKETAIVRREVGDGKWREIVSALHVEKALDGEKQAEDDEDVPF